MSSQAEVYLAELRNIVDEAETTDYIMPLWLPYLGAILMVLGGLGVLAATITGSREALSAAASLFGVLTFAGTVVEIYVVYKWIDRRNKHFARVHKLYGTVADLLEALTPNEPELAKLKSIVEEARFRERERSPGLWLILMLLLEFIAWAYIMHFLSRDFAEHEERERKFFTIVGEIVKRKGAVLEPPQRLIPDRNTILYAILTIVTLGFFGLYWVYTVTSDPNRHFQQHRVFERRLLEALEKLSTL